MLRNVISVIDGEAGSCGKAKVAGEIATDPRIKLGAAVTNCMPNAGHTFVDSSGNSTVFRNIPVAAVNPHTELFIGPGSAIDMDVFKDEYNNVSKFLGDRKIYVHEMVPIIEERHKEYERRNIKSGSTFKGCGAVTQEKVIRDAKLKFFQTYKNAVLCSNTEWLERLYNHLDSPFEYVLMEGAQGCDLDLNHSGNYPFVTSRNISSAQLLADCGISPERLLQTIMVIRPFPIRISNITKDGKYMYSGSYGTGDELTWSQVNISSMMSGYPCKEEYTELCGNIKYVKKLLTRLPEIFLKQLFGEHYRNIKLEEITLGQALEIERLVYKSKGMDEYQTKLIDVGWLDSDNLPNTVYDQSEQTTVTKMERRIFDLDIEKLKTNCRINTPSGLYLNFFQHLSYDYFKEKGNFDDFYFNRYLREYFAWLEEKVQSVTRGKTELVALGTGARNGERILKKELVRDIIRG